MTIATLNTAQENAFYDLLYSTALSGEFVIHRAMARKNT
jgi:hypothetical protein